MHRLAKHYGMTPRDLSPAIIEAWQTHNWPGNLRELEDSVKRYLMVGDEELGFEKDRTYRELEVQDVSSVRPWNVSQWKLPPSPFCVGVSGSKSLRSLVQSVKSEAEKSAIAAELEKTGWNRKAAARLLKVSYRTVLYKIEQYKMISPDLSRISENERTSTMSTKIYSNGKRG